MLVLDYEFDPKWKDRESDADLQSADEMSLRYDQFLGHIVVKLGDTDLSARWGWVPVLDFAVSLQHIVATLAEQVSEVFEFTESDETITFKRTDGTVHVCASYAPGTIDVSYSELRSKADSLRRRLLDDLAAKHPEFRDNPYIAKILEQIAEVDRDGR